MILRLTTAMITLGCASAALAQGAAAPGPQSAACAELDAEYSMTIPKLDQAVEEAVAVARKVRNEGDWAKAQQALARLAASEADYEALHTERGCSSPRFRLPEPWEREPSIDRSVKPFLLQFTHNPAATAGIGLLKAFAIPEGDTEIRIWIGFGVINPNHMLRLRVDGAGEVKGDVLVYFPHDLARRLVDGSTPEDALALWNGVVRDCKDVREGPVDDACFVEPARPTDWRAVHGKLVKLGIETLPDQDTLPPDDVVVLDGVSMVVEVRNGTRYRAYHYGNPGLHAQPEAQAAAEIIKFVVRTIRGATDQAGGMGR